MKTMKKILALTMVIAMVMAMVVTASAATITIQNSLPNTTYKFYQLMTYEESTGWYKPVENDTVKGILEKYFEFRDGYVVGQKGGENKLSETELASALMAELLAAEKENKVSARYTCTTNDKGTYNFPDDEAELGYYLMTSTVKNSESGTPRNNASLTLITEKNLVIREKNSENDLPKVEKTMQKDDEQYFVGDVRRFDIVLTMDEGDTRYTITDRMTGLKLTDADIQVTGVPEGAGYTVTRDADGEGFTVDILFTGENTSHANVKVTVVYFAEVQPDGLNEINNHVSVEDYSDSTPGNNPSDEVSDKQYDFTVKKTDEAGNQIEGAEFVLQNAAGKYAIFEKELDDANKETGNLILADWVDNKVDNGKIVIGSTVLKGIAAGEYILEETKAPAGYKFPVDATQEIEIEVDEQGNVSIGGDDEAPYVVAIENEHLEALPETGGMGTTIFYTMGGFMVLAAAAMVLTKKRENA